MSEQVFLDSIRMSKLWKYRKNEIKEHGVLAQKVIRNIFAEYGIVDLMPNFVANGRLNGVTRGCYSFPDSQSYGTIEISKAVLAYCYEETIIGIAKHEALHAVCRLYYRDEVNMYDGCDLFESLLFTHGAPSSAAVKPSQHKLSANLQVKYNFDKLIEDARKVYGDTPVAFLRCKECSSKVTVKVNEHDRVAYFTKDRGVSLAFIKCPRCGGNCDLFEKKAANIIDGVLVNAKNEIIMQLSGSTDAQTGKVSQKVTL